MLTFEHTPLLAAVKTLKKAMDNRTRIPVMQHVTVTSDAFGRAVLTASDLESWLSLTVDGSHCESGDTDFTVSRADLEKVLTGGDKGKIVTMTVQHGDNRDGAVTVQHDDIKVDLDILPLSDFPEAPAVTDTVHVPMSCHTARDVLTYCAGAMSTEETRYYLKGVYLHQYDVTGKLAAVATDGHRLNLAETGTCYDGAGVIVRDDAVKLLIDLIGKSDGAVQWHLPQESAIIRVTGEGWNLVTRKIDGTFPMYDKILPRETKGKGTLSCEKVSKAAARIARITSKQGAAILDITAGQVRHAGTGDGIKALSIDAGDMFPSGDIVPVGINPVYLEKAMSQVKVFSDTCTVHVTDESTPLRIHPRQMPSWAENMTSVVMPMRY